MSLLEITLQYSLIVCAVSILQSREAVLPQSVECDDAGEDDDESLSV